MRDRNQSFGSPWKSWNIERMVQILSFSGEAWVWGFSHLLALHWDSGSSYFESLHASLNCCFCSQWLPIWSLFVSAQIQARQKQVPQAAPRKIKMLAMCSSLFFPPHREDENWRFCPNHWCCFGGGIMVREYHRFSYWLQCGWLCMYPGYRCFSTRFWISHKWN